MRPTESEIKFENRLYLTLTNLESVIESINKWFLGKDTISRYNQALMKSRLALSTIQAIKSDLHSIGKKIERYVHYDQQCMIDSLEEITDASLGSYKNADKCEIRTLKQCSEEIETLLQAVQATHELMKDVFGDFLFSLTIQRPKRDCENDTAILRILDTASQGGQ